jgi:uncharacterized protein (DUF2147 family)
MKFWPFVATATLLLAGAGPLQAASPSDPQIIGQWLNPAGSVKVETKPCGTTVCGTVVWAGSKAIKDAKGLGVGQLLGTELMRGYRQESPTLWQGEVFLPRLNRWFSSRLERVGPDKLRISGCILAEMLCKSQTWKRA